MSRFSDGLKKYGTGWPATSDFCFFTIVRYIICIFFFLSGFYGFSMADTSSLSPVYRDSILKNKMDSARWNVITSNQDIYRRSGKNLMIQHPKQAAESTVFLYMSIIIGVLILLLRLLFSDFMVSLLEGILSVKKFFIHFKSNKYDTMLAVLWIYIVKLLLLALILYIALIQFTGRGFITFDTYFYIRILSSLSLFFVSKNLLEYIFNRVIQTEDSYKAFFLQNLFSELLIAVVLLLFLLVYIYNDFISGRIFMGSIIFCAAAYAFFNTIRSYQLMGNIRIVHKLHFFLYICAFKILPVLVLVKYILNNVVA